jgi:pilus assembly protein Flp/PilA
MCGISAQETPDAGKLRNEGIEAYEAKNYQAAFDKFSAYLSQTNYQDSVVAYNCGLCADKIQQPAEALKYFDIAIQKKYNLDNAYLGKANALKDLKRTDEYEATLKEAIAAFPENATLKRLLSNLYLNEGITAQKANKLDAAEKSYKEALEVNPENTNALLSLGRMSYNKAAGLAKDASKLDAAKKEFLKAKEYLDKLTPMLSPDKPADQKRLNSVKSMQTNITTILNSLK